MGDGRRFHRKLAVLTDCGQFDDLRILESRTKTTGFLHHKRGKRATAFDKGPWPRMSPAERAGFLQAIAAEIRERADELASIWTMESGVTFAMSNSRGPCLHLRELCEPGCDIPLQGESLPGRRSGPQVDPQPAGVVAAIVPWNSPAALMAHKCAPALLAGCTVILKASPEAPGAGYIFADICDKIGLPAGVLNFVTADREESELLVRHPDVDKIAFTGSTAAGKRIASICGERIARCTLELGGKSAAILLADFDPEQAARTLTASTTSLSGQVRAALTRIIVPKQKERQFVEALAACFSAVKVGDPFHSSSDMGPLATSTQRARVERNIAQGIAEGAKIAVGGSRPSHLDRGFHVEPTVFFNVDNQSATAREEIFGPVVAVIPYDESSRQ